jgi:chromosome segregation protein
MSYIKRLKLKGFKSFANPTTIEFEKKFNTIVGANGSGKSNVFDAMCFVLGRMSSKGLRADKLGNLVFNGGKNLKPSKEAEVSIFLSNENKEFMDVDLDEIKITRIVSKNGQSKYLLNNNKVTRTEILEVLSRGHINPDGYNIILQGDIMRIVNMSSIERRELIEDISNISGYEEKREKSLKKLEQVNLDLKEADLLMEEKTKYLKELKSEKELAEKYHKTKDDLLYNSLLLIKTKINKNKNLLNRKKEDLEKNEEKLSEQNKKLEDINKNIHEIDLEIEKLEKEIEVNSHKDFIKVTNEISVKETELKNKKEKYSENEKNLNEIKVREETVRKTIEKNKEKLKNLNSDKSRLEKKLEDEEKKLKEIEGEILEIKEKFDISSDFSKLEELDELIDNLKEKKENKLLIKKDNLLQIEKIDLKIEHINEQLKKYNDNISENKESMKELDNLRKDLKKIIVEISKKSNENAEISAKINNLNKELSNLNEDHSKLRFRVDSMRQAISQNRAVDEINSMQKRDKAIYGTVASLASVPNKYSQALETLAGKNLLNIVVEDDKTAVRYINYLKEKKLGVVTFLPLNKINVSFNLDNSVLNKKGVINYAINLIEFDPKFKKIFNLIFGDALVIEKIEDAKDIGIGQYRMVSLDGDLVSKAGAMSGGYRTKKSFGLLRDDKLEKDLEKIENKINTIRDTISLLTSQKSDLEREIYDLRTKKADIEGEISKLEKILSIEGGDSSKLQEELTYLEEDKKVISKSIEKQEKEIEELENEINKILLEKNKLKENSNSKGSGMSKLNILEEKREKSKDLIRKISSEIETINIQIKNVIEPEIKNLEKITIEIKESLEKLNKQKKEFLEEIKELETEIKKLKFEEKNLSKDYEKFIEQKEILRTKKETFEKKYNKQYEIYDKIKEKSTKLNFEIEQYLQLSSQLNLDLEQMENEIKYFFSEKYNISEEEIFNLEEYNDLIKKIDEKLEKEIDIKELQNRVNNLKTKLNSFGSINMKAVEIYDKLNEEFQKLLEKRQTLTDEKEEILKFIAEMDEKKRIKFMETFNQLREHFVRIYNKLSTKGEAELNLENENDIFNTGVEIKVKLSRNNYLDIKSLSGGEKTITAIAFIFAIQEFNPASFYIFDEVDAALDIINCEKLGKLIKEYSNKAQYIVVSHSEYLIQSSESIYGVTMDKNKISGVVSLDLSNMKDYLDEEEVKA